MISPTKRRSAAATSSRDTVTGARLVTAPSRSPVRRRHAEPHARAVGLVRIEQQVRKLGRLAEAHRQQTRRERIERAGMTRLGRAVEPLRFAQRGVRGNPGRLVEQQHAVARRAALPRWRAIRKTVCVDARAAPRLRASSATAASISCESRDAALHRRVVDEFSCGTLRISKRLRELAAQETRRVLSGRAWSPRSSPRRRAA